MGRVTGRQRGEMRVVLGIWMRSLVALAGVAGVAGCGSGILPGAYSGGGSGSGSGTTPIAGPALHGVVRGAGMPVAGAAVQLYAAGTTGAAAGATALGSAGTTDASGGFSVPAGVQLCVECNGAVCGCAGRAQRGDE